MTDALKLTFEPIRSENNLQMIKYYVSIVALVKSIKLSNTEKEILAYLMEGGINRTTKDAIIASGIIKNDSNLKNALTRLRILGLLQKDKWNEVLCPELSVRLKNLNLIKIYLDNR